MSEKLKKRELSVREKEIESIFMLKLRYQDQIRFLNQCGFLKILPKSQKLGIIGIEGKEYPIFQYNEILKKIANNQDFAPVIESPKVNGYDSLRLLPFAMPLAMIFNKFLNAFKEKIGGTITNKDVADATGTGIFF